MPISQGQFQSFVEQALADVASMRQRLGFVEHALRHLRDYRAAVPGSPASVSPPQPCPSPEQPTPAPSPTPLQTAPSVKASTTGFPVYPEYRPHLATICTVPGGHAVRSFVPRYPRRRGLRRVIPALDQQPYLQAQGLVRSDRILCTVIRL